MSFRLEIPQLVSLIVLIAVFAMATRVPASPDTWWHLRCGEVQWRSRAVLKSDLFSHTAAGMPWVNQSWLPQLAMYGLYTWGGFPALGLAEAALVAATLGFVILAARENAPPILGRFAPFWEGFVALWAAIATGRVWAPRPHLVTFALTAAWVYLLDRHRRRGRAGRIGALWWIPPLMLLWANAHGGYIVGFLLLSAEIVGRGLDSWPEVRSLWKEVRPLLFVTFASALATLVNPQGIRLIIFPFQTLGSHAQQGYVAEWASPDFHALDLLPFLALLLATWSALALSGHNARGEGLPSPQGLGVAWLRLTGFTAMALHSGRYLGLAAVVMAPLLIQYGGRVLARLRRERERPLSRPVRGSSLLNIVLLSLILAAGGLKVAYSLQAETIAQVHRSLFPVAAAEYLRTHDLPLTLFNDYGWGGYLIWALYPGIEVFIDGRADPYGDALIEDYRRAISATPAWQEILDAYGVGTALIRADSALATVMRESDRWKQVYADDLVTIFVGDPSVDARSYGQNEHTLIKEVQ